MKTIHYLMIARHLTGDSEILFFDSKEEAVIKFNVLTMPLLTICRENNGYDALETVITDGYDNPFAVRFNGADLPDLDAQLNYCNTFFSVGECTVDDDFTHYVAEFSEWVDESQVNFFNEEDANTKYIAMIEYATSEVTADGFLHNRINENTIIDEDDVTLLQISENEVYFGYSDPNWTIRINPIK